RRPPGGVDALLTTGLAAARRPLLACLDEGAAADGDGRVGAGRAARRGPGAGRVAGAGDGAARPARGPVRPARRGAATGCREGEGVVGFGGRTALRRETALLAYALRRPPPGDRVTVTVLRDGKRIELTLPMQE